MNKEYKYLTVKNAKKLWEFYMNSKETDKNEELVKKLFDVKKEKVEENTFKEICREMSFNYLEKKDFEIISNIIEIGEVKDKNEIDYKFDLLLYSGQLAVYTKKIEKEQLIVVFDNKENNGFYINVKKIMFDELINQFLKIEKNNVHLIKGKTEDEKNKIEEDFKLAFIMIINNIRKTYIDRIKKENLLINELTS